MIKKGNLGMEQVKGQSIKELVYEGILNDIIQGVYPANSILNERTLVEKYGVSKTPVREALVQLCSERILKNIPRYGYQLSVITPEEINDILEFRTILETSALNKTIKIITEEEINLLIAHAENAGKLSSQRDIITHWETNMEFHLMLCSYCDNQFLYEALKDSLKFCSRVATQYFKKSWERSKLTDAVGHVRLMEAVRSKNTELASRLLIADIGSMKDEILGRD